MATLKEENLPKAIKGILDEFKGMIPPELLKRLPKRKKDHHIELELEVKPPSIWPFS